ncbi:pilus assembly protein FilA [Acinetobacter sp. ANC 3903]|jgi:hypothetical protein|uniref:putative pilus system protein FilA n=1 Tax=Acinetobacter sp. ANC 3903 TaxID=1977883 RepID=UPI000A32E0B4|nr:DUF6160 family protein [Acinetobacter sp. ANC 3903]OTG63132.1 pilus assembly protein FilA [Acinetobacter sp. ANC 3903]
MKKFTKLALVSSLAISANAMAMQAMDDASLGATTGQDGINIGIGISKIEIEKLLIHDNDGLTATALGGTSTAGAIVIKGNGTGATATNGIVIAANMASLLPSHNLADLQIDTDAGTTAAGGAFINIAAQVSGLDISIGEIGVAKSGDAAATGIRRGASDNYNKIITGLNIKTGVMTANVQLGASPQGAMINLSTTMQGGLTISDLGIHDSAGGGDIWLGKIQVADANGTDLSISNKIKVTPNGLVILNDSPNATDIYVQAIALGSKPASVTTATPLGARGTATAGTIGDVEVQGLQTYYMNSPTSMAKGSVITISGR